MKFFNAFKEILDFLKVRKKWWLTPIMLFLVLFGLLIVFSAGSPLAPFIYTLF
jgi:hypothetical protein